MPIAPHAPHPTAARLQDDLRRERDSIYAGGVIQTEAGEERAVASAGVDAQRGAALRDLVAAENARTCLETGFAYAMSASFILDALLDHPANTPGVPTEPVLVSMDPYQQAGFGNAGRGHLKRAGAAGLHTLFQEKSEAVLPRLLAAGRRFDTAFIDGDHRFDGVFLDVFYACRLVGAGRLVILDDLYMPAIRKCVGFVTSSGICAAQTRPDIPRAEEFALLRVLPGSDKRAWDHWVEF